jgi:opacity protein-like surface antigen
VRHNIAPTVNVFGGARFDMLEWTADRADPFDQDSYSVNGGAAWTRDNDTFTALLEARWFTVDNDLFRRTVGGTLQWSRLLTQRSRISSFFRVADIGYHPRSQQAIRDVTQYLGGIGYTYIFGTRGEVVASGRLHGGVEDEQASAVDHLGRAMIGGRVSVDWSFKPDFRAFGAFALEYSDYGGEEPLFLESRNDTNYAVSAGVAWNFAERWVLTPSIRYMRNDSDITTSDYDSISGMVTVRFTY